jgi:hypothetical protein
LHKLYAKVCKSSIWQKCTLVGAPQKNDT